MYLALPRIVLAFVVGILCAQFFPSLYCSNIALLVWCGLLLGCFYLLSRLKFFSRHLFRKYVGTGLLVVSSLSGLLLALHAHQFAQPDYFYQNETSEYHLRLELSEGKSNGDYWNGIAYVVGQYSEHQWRTKGGKIYVTVETSDQLNSGVLLEVKGYVNLVKGPRNPGGFDMRAYLYSKNIQHQAFIQKENFTVIACNPSYMSSVFQDLRSYSSNVLNEYLSEKSSAIANALILGDKSQLEDEVRTSFALSGAMHILAVSGLHVGIIVLLINGCIGYWRRNEKYRWGYVIIGLSAIWFYALITGLPVSVQRAGLMFSFFVVGSALQRKQDSVLFVIASAFILLLFNPYVIYDVGFQLSYAAVLGIIYLQPPLKKLFYSRFFVVQKINEVCAVSIAAQIATLPFTVYYFGYFPVYFLITNIVILPLTPVILILGLMSILLMAVFPILGKACLFLLDYFIYVLNFIMEVISNWPMSIIKNGSISLFTALIIGVAVILLSAAIIRKTIRTMYTALLGLIIVFSALILEKNSVVQNQYFVIFYAKNQPAFALNSGTAVWAYGPEKNISDYADAFWVSNVRREVKENPFKTAQPVEWNNAVVKNKCLKVDECVCCQIDRTNTLIYKNVDFLWVTKNQFIDLKNLHEMNWQGTIILDPSNSFSHRSTIQRVAQKYDINTYDIKSNGAFVYQL